MEESLPIKMHRELHGKVHTYSDIELENVADMALFYTPGVYDACLEIKTDKKKSYDFTGRKNTVAIISNGSSVVGFENIGNIAVKPLLESKALLYKKLAGIDTVNLSINSKKAEDIANTILSLQDNFAAIDFTNVSDDLFLSVSENVSKLSIPFFDDENYGLACVIYAGIMNAIFVSEKNIETVKFVFDTDNLLSLTISRLLTKKGATNIVICNKQDKIEKKVDGADILVSFSVCSSIDTSFISKMNEKPAVFTCSYPVASVTPDSAEKAGAFVVSSLRTDRPNQISNAIAFPGLIKGTILSGTKKITDEMMIACGDVIAESVRGEDFCSDYLLPTPFDENLVDKISLAVKRAAKKSSR